MKTFVDVAQTPESVSISSFVNTFSLGEVLHPSDHLSIAADLCFRINRAWTTGLGLHVSLTWEYKRWLKKTQSDTGKIE